MIVRKSPSSENSRMNLLPASQLVSMYLASKINEIYLYNETCLNTFLGLYRCIGFLGKIENMVCSCVARSLLVSLPDATSSMFSR
jgi:hypothetical protein